MSLRRPSRERDDATFDLTPMIDVVLLLIIFFMLTSQFTSADRAAVDLPAQPGVQAAKGAWAELVVDVDANGAPSIAGKPISVEGLVNEALTSNAAAMAAARRKGSAGPGLRVLIRADKACPTPALQSLCAAISNAGVTSFSLATSGEGDGGKP